ncbi:MAG TPA: DinB family protein [Candidatus Polarisedimenticolia bacterium]|nr:DinB family protein [Candidatus Polarisedimenticolia bacterium]
MSPFDPLATRRAARARSAADHPGLIRSFFPLWDSMYRPFLISAVEALPEERFEWKPRPEMFTAQQIVVHIAECERGWIHGTLDGGPYEEFVVPVDGDDLSKGWKTAIEAPDRKSLLDLLETWHRPTQRWLEKPVSELSRGTVSRVRGGPDREHTVHWVLDNLQQHEIHHRSQLLLYLRLMGIEPPLSM